MGDVKLALLLGAGLGWTVGGRDDDRDAHRAGREHGPLRPPRALGAEDGYPLGPFLAFGALVALFWGEGLLDAYLSRF